jgi:hypothetical protein
MRAIWVRDGSASFLVSGITGAIMVGAPRFVIFAHIAISDFEGSLFDYALHLTNDLCSHLPRCNTPTSIAYAAWFLTQAALSLWLPDPIGSGQPTPLDTS